MGKPETSPKTQLRILATTDLHMHLLAYDYFADRPDAGLGLGGLSEVITRLRSENPAGTVLCDNGDFLEGNPLADHLAATLGPEDTHPMIAAQNALGYDAITLGNHDLDFGLPFLRQVLAQSRAAVVSANLSDANGIPVAPKSVILSRHLVCDDGQTRTIKIAITGLAPPQTQSPDHADPLVASDIVDAARQIMPEIKRAGADVVIALCHSGIASAQHTPRMENAAVPLAAVAGLDVLVLGHTHDQFPDAQLCQSAEVDPVRGTLHGKPAVMAGYYGTSLGVIDLNLGWRDGAWHIAGHAVRLVKPAPRLKGHDAITPLVQAPHLATLTKMRAPIAQTAVRIQNYFATVQPDISLQILAQAMRDAVPKNIADVPILAAVAPFRDGGRNGRGQFIDIAPGEITLRDAAAIFPFSDKLYAVRRTGAQIRQWLERSASHYNMIVPHKPDQALLNPRSAGYNCDALYGLRYDIDLGQPSRFDAFGSVIAPMAARITNLTALGRPVADTDSFVVATNAFRANGGGGFAQVPAHDILWQSQGKLRDIVIAALTAQSIFDQPLAPLWRFAPITGGVAQFQSSPTASNLVSGPLVHVGAGTGPFDNFAITF